jgi:hypothetical protein
MSHGYFWCKSKLPIFGSDIAVDGVALPRCCFARDRLVRPREAQTGAGPRDLAPAEGVCAASSNEQLRENAGRLQRAVAGELTFSSVRGPGTGPLSHRRRT